MAQNTYEASLARVLAHEGGYTNHPSDPGGPTNYGITIHDYRAYVKPGATAADVRAMRLDEAKAIYRSKYWNALRCDDLPAGLDYAVFDYGVNSGIGRSGKVLRRLLGLSDATHTVTDDVLREIAKRDTRQLVAALCDERLAFLKRLKTWSVFGKGWERRVAEVRAAAMQMAGPQQRTPAAAPASLPGKGVVPVESAKQKATAGGIVAAGAAAAQQAHANGVSPVAVAAILLIAAALAVAAWIWWRRRQTNMQEN